MAVLAAVSALLGWIGRQGPRAIAATVIIAILLPPLDALLRPFVTAAIVALLCAAFVRVDLTALRTHISRPGLVLAATAWVSLATPALLGLCCWAAHLAARSPDLFLGLMFQAVTTPMMAAPAFAALMGLDPTLVLAVVVAGAAITPFTAPIFVHIFIGAAMTLSPLALGTKLLAIMAASLAAALIIRRLAGAEKIRRASDQIDGINILLAFVFVGSVMQDVAPRFLADPLGMIGLTALAFAVNFSLLGLSALVFLVAGRERSFIIGLTASQRNLGLMLAATGGAVPDLTWLYVAVSQFPLYLAPLMLMPLARRLKTGGKQV